MFINMKKNLKHITQYCHLKQSSLQEASIVILTRTSTALTPKASKQLNIFTGPCISVLFSIFTISFISRGTSQLSEFQETKAVRLPVKSNFSINTEGLSPLVCSKFSKKNFVSVQLVAIICSVRIIKLIVNGMLH